jgi:hypothetical protein
MEFSENAIVFTKEMFLKRPDTSGDADREFHGSHIPALVPKSLGRENWFFFDENCMTSLFEAHFSYPMPLVFSQMRT